MAYQMAEPIKILVADDEEMILELYNQILSHSFNTSPPDSEIEELEAELFGESSSTKTDIPVTSYELTFCKNGQDALEAVLATHAAGQAFAMAFLDVRMPPGPDGIWTAEKLRAISPNTQIVIVTGYSDIDPEKIEKRVPPPNRLLYLQKPFHPFEIRQFASTLAARWKAEKMMLTINQELKSMVEKRTAELQKTNKQLEHQATRDYLTQLLNRRGVFDMLKRDISRNQRIGTPISIILADLDFFKRINDTYGHTVGDAVLKEIAKKLREGVRPYDSVGRIGGEEFLIVLPDCDSTEGVVVAERIRASIGDEKMKLSGKSLSVTVSIGVATASANQSVNKNSLIKAADKALYDAKNDGRNKVKTASEIKQTV